jgi:hypothetical protein
MVFADADEKDVSSRRMGAVKVMTAELLGVVVGVGLMLGLGLLVAVGVLVAVTVGEGVAVGSTEAELLGLFNANAATAITATATTVTIIINNLFMPSLLAKYLKKTCI